MCPSGKTSHLCRQMIVVVLGVPPRGCAVRSPGPVSPCTQPSRHATGTTRYGRETNRRYSSGEADPDILYYDLTQPASYPHNGRTPSDDVKDGFIAILANGRVTRDNAGPRRPARRLLLSWPAAQVAIRRVGDYLGERQGFLVVACPGWRGMENEKVAPGPSFAAAHRRP